MTRELGVMRKMGLIEGELEGKIMGVAIEFSSLCGSLYFFLGKVSVLMRDAERKDDCTRCGNGGCRRKFPSHKLVWESPSVVRLDRTGAEDSTSGLGYDDRSVFLCMHHEVTCCKGSEADEFVPGAEAESTDMSGMDSCSVGTGDGDGSGKLDGLEKIC